MAKAEWGTKRVCLNCGARFYDMLRDPITCPTCGTVFDPTANLKTRRSRTSAKAEAAEKETPKKVAKTDDDEEMDVDDEVEADEADLDSDDDSDVSDEAVADGEDDDEESQSAIEDVSELGDDDVSDVIDADVEDEDGTN